MKEGEGSVQSKREKILHDLKHIAIAINELCRDLDTLERENIKEIK